MFRRILAAAVLVALAAVLVIAVWPQLLGLERTPIIAQLVSLRAAAVAFAAILVVAFTLVALVSERLRRFAASVALLLLVFCAIRVAVLATRGVGGGAFPTTAPGDLIVLGWNTLGDAPRAETIAELALDRGGYPGAARDERRKRGHQAANLTSEGRPMQELHLSLDEISKARTTSLLISADLGEYAVKTPPAAPTPCRACSPCRSTERVRGSSPRILSPRSPARWRPGGRDSSGSPTGAPARTSSWRVTSTRPSTTTQGSARMAGTWAAATTLPAPPATPPSVAGRRSSRS